MKIVSIVSSFRKNGNTERLVELVEEEILLSAGEANVPVEIERISLAHHDIQSCRGCRICFDRGEESCPLKDDLLLIRDKIAEADGIIMASPVYVEDINGIMKNWIDRMAFNCHRPAFAGKVAVLLTTSGVGSSNHALNTMNKALGTWGFHIAGKGKFRTGALMKSDEMKTLYHKKIKSLSGSLLNALKLNKALKPSFYSLIVFKVQQKYWQKAVNYRDTVDFAYWSGKGWLEPHCEFYTQHRSNWLKVKVARFIGSVVGMFFT